MAHKLLNEKYNYINEFFENQKQQTENNLLYKYNYIDSRYNFIIDYNNIVYCIEYCISHQMFDCLKTVDKFYLLENGEHYLKLSLITNEYEDRKITEYLLLIGCGDSINDLSFFLLSARTAPQYLAEIYKHSHHLCSSATFETVFLSILIKCDKFVITESTLIKDYIVKCSDLVANEPLIIQYFFEHNLFNLCELSIVYGASYSFINTENVIHLLKRNNSHECLKLFEIGIKNGTINKTNNKLLKTIVETFNYEIFEGAVNSGFDFYLMSCDICDTDSTNYTKLFTLIKQNTDFETMCILFYNFAVKYS